MRYKQAIQIGSNVTDIMRLPCVISCCKQFADEDFNELLVYTVYIDSEDYGEEEHDGYIDAHFGDWLCEDYDGQWHLLSDKEYKDGLEDREQCGGA